MDETAQYSGTMPVSDRHAFDVGRLEDWMKAHVDGFSGPLEVEQFKGGQSNPTFRLKAGSGRYVLRRKPPGTLLPSAHAVDREYAVISALKGTGVPVPQSRALCTDDSVIGAMFYIMDYVEGRILWNPLLPDYAPAERAQIYDAMNETIARLHQVDYQAVGLDSFGKPGNYFARQISRWSKQYKASETDHIEAMERLMDWLPAHIPAGDEAAIVHGDYRIDNMIFHPTENRVVAILDWELSTIGHPLGDFAYHCMGWRLTGDLYRGTAGVDHAATGIPSEADYVTAYCRRTGRGAIPHWDYYMAFNIFRLAAILQGIMGRVRDGTAASAHAEEQGRRARPLAEFAWRLVEERLL